MRKYFFIDVLEMRKYLLTDVSEMMKYFLIDLFIQEVMENFEMLQFGSKPEQIKVSSRMSSARTGESGKT